MNAVLAVILALAAFGQGSVLVSRAKVSPVGRLPEARHLEENDFDRRERWMHPSAPYSAHHDGLLGDSADDHGDNVRPRGPQNEWDTVYWREKGKGSVESLAMRKENTGVAKNLIIFMGDGMSVPTLAATRVYMGNENQSLSFEKFPVVGLSKTYCVDTQVADSACSATAYLCGVKANMATMGVNAHVLQGNCTHQLDTSNHVDSVLAWGQRAGKWAGFVTTTRVTHASPGGTYAHIAERNWESDYDQHEDKMEGGCSDIAKQLVRDAPGKDFRVILGGGRRAFVPNSENKQGHRLDGVNLIKEWQDDKKKQGKSAEYVTDKAELEKVDISKTEYLLGLFQWSHMDYHLDAAETQPTLAELTRTAIKMLSKQDKGFVLFVEGGRIDHGHHDDQAHYALDETQQFSEAVQMAVDMTKEEDTLIVVTSDHAHTMSMAGYAARGNDVFQFAGTSKMDKMKYTTLSYANGPSAPVGTTRTDPSAADTEVKDFKFPSTAPLDSETHGGDDVAIFARGPWSHLYTGVHEQHLIPHIMAYAARIEMFQDRALVGAAPAAHQAALASLLPALLVPALSRLLF